MKVFKFGGASVNNPDGVRNIAKILSGFEGEKLVIVISAMGKTTHALENLTETYWKTWNENLENLDFTTLTSNPVHILADQLLKADFSSVENGYKAVFSYHLTIINDLFKNKSNPVYPKVQKQFIELLNELKEEPSQNYDFDYDQIVSFGEILSTIIVSEYLKTEGINNQWIDIRRYLITDNNYRDPKIEWDLSDRLINKAFSFQTSDLYITQGFLGSTSESYSTTLGKEGSDYSAALMAYFLNALEVIIWKDVDGIYNADPKFYKNPRKINRLSYKEAIELTYYGAKVIHPKTIKPLQNKLIPLYVRSFLEPENEGTVIGKNPAFVLESELNTLPVFIIKKNQVLISISPKDFSFIAEENLSNIFALLNKFRIRANLTQNSATDFSVCVDFNETKVANFLNYIPKEFEVGIEKDIDLITIQNYNDEAIKEFIDGRIIKIQQKSESVARFVVR